MADRLEGANQLNEILFQDPIDSFPHRDNYSKITALVSSHAGDIEALQAAGAPPAGPSAEVIASRDDQPDLQSAIRKADEILGDGVFENVVNEFRVKESTLPDDKVDVDTGEAIINGKKVLTSSIQVVDPANFSAASLERIDVVHVDSSGTVAVTTGLEAALGSGLAEAERPPDNTVVLALLFLRSGAGNLSPFPPEDIRKNDNLTDSFVVLNLQRFFVQRDRTDPHRHPSNLLANGAMASVDSAGAVSNWTLTRGTLVQESGSGNFIFSDFSGKFTGDGTAGGSFIEQELASPESLRGKFLSVSAYLKLGPAIASKTGRITIRQVGDTPESDFSVSASLNGELFQRLHVVDFIDNSVTAVFIRIEVDTTNPSTVVGFIEGVQASVGRILTEFEWPERIRKIDDGSVNLEGTIGGDITFTGDTIFTGDSTFEGNMAWQWPPPFDIFTNVRLITRT